MSQMQNTCCEICGTWLGCACCTAENEYRKEPLAEITPNEHRHCTDVPCLLILLLVLASQAVLIFYAKSKHADIKWITHGIDWQGKTCDSLNPQGSHAAWPDPTYPQIRVCVQSCAETSISHAQNPSSPFSVGYPSSALWGTFCVPTISNATWSKIDKQTSTNRAVADLAIAKYLIIASIFIATFLAFGYLYIVAGLGACLIRLTLFLVLAGGCFLTGLLIKDGVDRTASNPQQGHLEVVVGVILGVVTFLFLLSLLWLRKRIELALALLNEASLAIRDMKGTLIFPLWTSLIAVGYVAFACVVSLYIYSVATKRVVAFPFGFPNYLPNAPNSFVEYTFDKTMQNSMVYNVIAIVLVLQTVIYYGFSVTGGAIADWYFSEWEHFGNKEKKIRGNGRGELSAHPVCESSYRVCRFHIGSLAMGALLVTPIRIANWILTYIISKTESSSNRLLTCVLGCAKCCLKCLECIINSIAQEGFIFMAIYGTNFCYSSITGVKLIWENAGRALAVEGISKYMEIIGKASITLMTTGIACLVLKYLPFYKQSLSAVTVPAVVVFVIAYVISSLFMTVFEVAIDAVFLSFLVDESVNGAKFASDSLLEIIGMKPEQKKKKGYSGMGVQT